MAIELPEFATSGASETEPSTGLKGTGWAAGDEPPHGVFNWLHRTNYESHLDQLALNRLSLSNEWQKGALLDTFGANYDDAVSDGDYIILVSSDENSFNVSSTGVDGPFTEEYHEADTVEIDAVFAVPGEYAVCVKGTAFYSAASPYTAWSKITATFTSSAHVSGVVTSLGSTSRLVLVRGTYLIYTSATSRPTVAGDWTELNLSSILGELSGIATDGTNNVICGSDGATTGRIAYAAISAGTVVGDWTTVDIGSSTLVTDVIYSDRLGEFIAIDEDGQVFRSSTPSTWTAVGAPLDTVVRDWRLVHDPKTGATLAYYDATGTINTIYGSRNGLFYSEIASSAGLSYGSGATRPRIRNIPSADRFLGGKSVVSFLSYPLMTP